MSRLFRTLSATMTGGALVALTACAPSAASPSGASPTPTSSSERIAPQSAVASPATDRDTSRACTGLPMLGAEVMGYPGADPDSPPATAAQLRQWARTTSQALESVAGSVPVELDSPISVIRASLASAQQGQPVDEADDDAAAALSAVDKWGHDTCGFPTLDVVNPGSGLDGVPASLPAGPVSISFTNAGPSESAGFVLLAMRVRDGAEYTLEGVRNGSEDPGAFADVTAAVQPVPGSSTGFATANLPPGDYVIVSPTGAPPKFSGILATELKINSNGERIG